MRVAGILLLSCMLSACGGRSDLADHPTGTACIATPPTCVQPADDPCGAPTTTAAVCDGPTRAWVCPGSSHPYARATGQPSPCLPFSDPSTGVATAGPWGLSSITRVPTEDGRCLWIAEDVKFRDGTEHRNVAFEPDLSAPSGTCPTTTRSPPTPIVVMEGGEDPSVLVQLDGGYRLAGKTHVLYRLFQIDPTSAFGVRELGSGVARWDPVAGRIVVPSAQTPFPWGKDLDLGTAMLVTSADPVHALVWGCSKEHANFVDACVLARLDGKDDVEILSQGGQWIAGTDPAGAAPQFTSGPWISTVLSSASTFEHVYIAGFGGTLETHTASSAIGPWSDGLSLGGCLLPAGDPMAFCAGPVAHPELADPTRTGELVVSYSIGTTGSQTGNLADYWPRLVWTQ